MTTTTQTIGTTNRKRERETGRKLMAHWPRPGGGVGGAMPEIGVRGKKITGSTDRRGGEKGGGDKMQEATMQGRTGGAGVRTREIKGEGKGEGIDRI